jgi:hypothetical protein
MLTYIVQWLNMAGIRWEGMRKSVTLDVSAAKQQLDERAIRGAAHGQGHGDALAAA